MRRRIAFYILGLLLGAALIGAFWPRPAPRLAATIVAAAAPLDTSGFAHADGPRPFVFPADYGPHNDYQTEWWYYTGNLTDQAGAHFGYQLTLFRRALVPPAERVQRPSAWATDQVYMVHFALTDVAGGQHHSVERFSRGSAGLADAQAAPYHVWLEDWSVTAESDGRVRLQAKAAGFEVALTLHNLTDPVPEGDHGYSRKGPEPGNASYYYSLPRIDTAGQVVVAGRTFQVTGLSWMDHEYSTSALGPALVGWDWYSLQLDDGSEVMLYALRRADGTRDPFSSGTLIAPDGSTRTLGPSDFETQALGQWRSPRTGSIYPSGWQVSVPSAGLRLTITPYLADQEMQTSLPYWEGAVRIEGTRDGRAVAGNGYAELTGYAKSLQGQF